MLKEGNDTRERAEHLCAQAGFFPKIRLQLDQQLAAYTLAGFGLGAAFYQRYAGDERSSG